MTEEKNDLDGWAKIVAMVVALLGVCGNLWKVKACGDFIAIVCLVFGIALLAIAIYEMVVTHPHRWLIVIIIALSILNIGTILLKRCQPQNPFGNNNSAQRGQADVMHSP